MNTPDPQPALPTDASKNEPKVESKPSFKTGDSVMHANKTKYIVKYQTPEGVALEGVANLVNPETLKLVR